MKPTSLKPNAANPALAPPASSSALGPFIAQDQVLEFIRNRILEGQYQAGQYLSESILQKHPLEANLDFVFAVLLLVAGFVGLAYSARVRASVEQGNAAYRDGCDLAEKSRHAEAIAAFSRAIRQGPHATVMGSFRFLLPLHAYTTPPPAVSSVAAHGTHSARIRPGRTSFGILKTCTRRRGRWWPASPARRWLSMAV